MNTIRNSRLHNTLQTIKRAWADMDRGQRLLMEPTTDFRQR